MTVRITFKLPDGSERNVEVADGTSVMRAAVQYDVPGIEGECGGEMSCGTCHVYVGDELGSVTRAASNDELDILESFDNRTDRSRLGCQVKITGAVSACVEIPAS